MHPRNRLPRLLFLGGARALIRGRVGAGESLDYTTKAGGEVMYPLTLPINMSLREFRPHTGPDYVPLTVVRRSENAL